MQAMTRRVDLLGRYFRQVVRKRWNHLNGAYSSPLFANGRSQKRLLGAVKTSRLTENASRRRFVGLAGLCTAVVEGMGFLVTESSPDESMGDEEGVGLYFGVLCEFILASVDL